MPAREPDGAKVILHIQQHPTLRRIRSPSERIRSRDSGKTEVRKFGGYQSYETEAVETTLSAKRPGEESCGGGQKQSTNLGDGEQGRIR